MRGEQAPTLVLLHGLLGDRQDWEGVTAQLDMPTLALDLPGHGDNPAEVDSFDGVHRWLGEALSRRGIRRYALLGYSLGGRLALYHASQHPPGLAALWLESAHPGLAVGERPARIAHDAAWAGRFAGQPLIEVLNEWYRQPVFADVSETRRRALIQRRLHNHGPAIAHMLRATSLGRQPSLWAWLERTRLPVGYLSGRQDAKFHALACQLAERAPHIEHAPLNGGHNLHSEHPEQVARKLATWYQALVDQQQPR